MNDELIERLAELLEHTGRWCKVETPNPLQMESLANEARAMYAIINRVRSLVGGEAITPEILRKALQ